MADKKQKALNPRGKWIDLDHEDKSHPLRWGYVKATVMAGATSIQKLMAVTYLSQFEDLQGEFAVRPVFTPDFQVGIIPYSSELLVIYNELALALNSVKDGQNLSVQIAENTQATIDAFVRGGAQFSRLYSENQRNLTRFQDNERDLYTRVGESVQRDRNLIKGLAYLIDPITKRSEEE